MISWALAAVLALAAPPNDPPPAPVGPPVPAAAKDNPKWQVAGKQLTTMLALLAMLAALTLLLGGFTLWMRRWGRMVAKRQHRLPVKYHDLTILPEPEPPHEPSAEERWRPYPPE